MENEVKEIKLACTTSDYLDLDQIVPFQGRFKLRTQKDIEILAGYILEQGFSCPFFIWDKDGEYLILDGHGRYLALDYLKTQGYSIPKLPVVIVEAEDEKDARLKVLELNNVNGVFSKEVLLDYAKALTIDFSTLHIAGLDFSDVQNKFEPTFDPEIAEKVVTEESVKAAHEKLKEYRAPVDTGDYRDLSCPKCHYAFSVKVK
ncbi:MAG: ParB N-terminal domain-containing protein [Firmicutes bacterium]|nr:ParB N-terminal domain-containing protein [Bacillota bacterium]